MSTRIQCEVSDRSFRTVRVLKKKERGFSHTESLLEVSVERTVDNAEHPDDCREPVPMVKKIEKIEVHKLQLSYQMADVQSSRNDERLQLRSGEHQ